MAESPSIPKHDAHPSPPQDDASLKDCLHRSRELLRKDNRWRQDFLSLHFRTLCLPRTLVYQGFTAFSKVIDVATMHPLDPQANPELTALMDFATRAGLAALMLYRSSGPLNEEQSEKIDWAMGYYCSRIQLRAEKLNTDATVDELRLLAACCTFSSSAGAPKRDWSVLMGDDLRWCLVAPANEWPALMNDYPQARPYLTAFAMLNELVSPVEALNQLWRSSAPTETIVLPDLDGPSL